MSKRLESLRSQLTEIEARRSSAQARSLELAERDEDINDVEADELRSAVKTYHDLAPEIDALRAEIDALESVLNAPERARVAAPTVLVRQADPIADESAQYGPTEQVRGAAKTAIERLPLTDDHVRERLYATLERADDPSGRLSRHMIAASRPAYRSAFAKLITGQSYALTADEVRSIDHVRAASLTDAAGGYAVPTVTDPTLIVSGVHDGLTGNVIRQLATVRQITGDNLNLVTSAGVTASWAAEMAEATDDAPTLGQVTINPSKAHVNIPFSAEVGADWVGMEAEMRRLMMIAKDDLELEAFTTGNGTNRPLGLFYDIYTNYTGQVQASAGANAFAEADLYALVAKVAARYRGRGSWIANEIIYDKVRQFNVATAGVVWSQLAVDRPPTLLGRPAYGNAQVDGTYGSGENYVLLFGDVAEAYTIVDRVGMSVELVPHLFGTTNNMPTGMRSLYASWRTGAKVVVSTAVAVLNVT